MFSAYKEIEFWAHRLIGKYDFDENYNFSVFVGQ